MASTQTTQRCTYRYDPLDRLINQTQPDTPTHQRFYCKSRLATEIQGATKHSIIQHDDLLLAQQQREGDALDTTLLATDLQRSVLHTLKKATQPKPIAYSPYGHRPAFNGLLSLLGFNGERADPVSGHYLLGNGYRAFNPVLMRFNSPDSLSPFEEGGFNPYGYCLGDPINKTDQDGHAPFSLRLTQKLLMKARQAVARKVKTNKKITIPEDGEFILKPGVSELKAAHVRSHILRQKESITAKHSQNKLFLDDLKNPEKIDFKEGNQIIEQHLRKNVPEVIKLTYNNATRHFPNQPEAFDLGKLVNIALQDNVLGPVAKTYMKRVTSAYQWRNSKFESEINRIRDTHFIRKS
jgi:RHS repeat-associated protein